MRYKFRRVDFKEELEAVVARPAGITDTGDELLIDFGDYTLTPQEEGGLKDLLATKPLLRGRLCRFVEKGADVLITRSVP